jgi:hypothetical protein
MALLGLLLLPSSYRAGAESAHAHSLIQLWADAANGTIRHHLHHRLAHPASGFSSSWLDPVVRETETSASVASHDEKPDAAEQQESAPVSSGVHLLLTAMMAIAALAKCPVPVDLPGRRRHGLPPPILVPPPRWTPAAS